MDQAASRIKHFCGSWENAMETKIWSTVSICALIAIVKKRRHLNVSLYTLLQILFRHHLQENAPATNISGQRRKTRNAPLP
jgi:hypothetical protein